MNQLESILFTIVMVTFFPTLIFFIIFGQVTVRKLRKNQETKDALGVELASGLDVLNVAGALARPKWLTQKLVKTPIGRFFYADTDLLRKRTNKVDKVLASVFYWLYLLTGIPGVTLGLLSIFGAFD